MATSDATRKKYHTCNQETITYICTGCSKHFSFDDLVKHRESVNLQFHQVPNQQDQLNKIVSDKLETQYQGVIKQFNQLTHTQVKHDSSTEDFQRPLINLTPTPEQTSVYCCKHLRCYGRACAKCDCCRDWYWHPDGDRKYYTKRANADCICDEFTDDCAHHETGFYGFLGHLCECEDNQ